MKSDYFKMSSEDLRNSISLEKKIWKHIFTTNCYAYSLGLDIRERKVMPCAYVPGNIGNSKNKIEFTHCFTYTNLLENIFDDLDYMRIEARKIEPTDSIAENEWKIALFTTFLAYEEYKEYITDFHFLREASDGTWYHKRWLRRPTNKDSERNIITDPKGCHIKGYEYKLTLGLHLKYF